MTATTNDKHRAKKTVERKQPKAQKSGIIAGLNKGHKTTLRAVRLSSKISLSKPKKKLTAVKAIISELVGLSPLERRVQEMLRVGKEKRALKYLNKRLGNIKAAKKRRSKIEEALRQTTTSHHKKH